MNILGIETSCSVCSVGFVDERGRTTERNIIDPHIHSEKLLTLAEEVMKQAETDFKSLDAIAVSIGPGSFTGLRIGLSTAKGLCYSLGRSLIAVSSFEVVAHVAHQSKPGFKRIVVAVDARQGEFYVGSVDWRTNSESTAMEVRISPVEDLPWPGSADDSTLWVTDGSGVARDHGVQPDAICEYASFCRGDAVALRARSNFERNEIADLASIEPLYLKNFVVKTAAS